ncbi:hypothetical protein KCP75_15600 [Salmonella enterica subsp. enterica]|nr:hypothetical protein KCP75_15600 [Salmonella enterica subsp. enterica]
MLESGAKSLRRQRNGISFAAILHVCKPIYISTETWLQLRLARFVADGGERLILPGYDCTKWVWISAALSGKITVVV